MLEIGTELGLSGVGFLAAGASAYLGIELAALTREMLAADFRMSALEYLPAEQADAERLQRIEIAVIADELKADPAARRVLEALPADARLVTVRHGRQGRTYELA